jgi:hypothetical protein
MTGPGGQPEKFIDGYCEALDQVEHWPLWAVRVIEQDT